MASQQLSEFEKFQIVAYNDSELLQLGISFINWRLPKNILENQKIYKKKPKRREEKKHCIRR